MNSKGLVFMKKFPYETGVFLELHLRECPFCGGTRVKLERRVSSWKYDYKNFYMVRCLNCKAQGPTVNVDDGASKFEHWRATNDAMNAWGTIYTDEQLNNYINNFIDELQESNE